MRVRAMKRCYIGILREKGEEFDFHGKELPAWLVPVAPVEHPESAEEEGAGDPAPDSLSARISEALDRLDPVLADHWTATGKPRMDVIEGMLGDTSITREDVEAARPGFRRPEF